MLGFLQSEKFESILLVILLFSAITNGELLPSASLTLEEIHLVRCLTHISHRYFSPGRSLVISSPATYRDVKQELTAEIHGTSIWPVVLTVDSKISKPENRDFIDIVSGYIIIIPDGDLKSLHAEFKWLVLGRSTFTKLWNSETRFVVAGANEFSLSQKTKIFDFLSHFRIYNCIIVSREHYVFDKKYIRPIKDNDVDTGMQLGVYTWFPYLSSDHCTEVNDITLLDSWVIAAQGHFTKNTDLFPRKISNNLKGCPMKAVVRDCQSNFTAKYVNLTDSNGSVVSYVQGLEIDLLKVVLKQMNMTFLYVPVTKSFELRVGNLEKYLVTSMIAKKCYIVMGGVGNYLLSNPFFDSSNTHNTMRIRWYVPCSVKYPRWSSIFRILSVELWIVLIISIVIAAISTTLVGRYSCTSEWQVYKTLTSSLTNVWAVILGVSVSKMPRAPSLLLLFLAWVCFSLAFSTVFQAFLTTYLVDSGYKTPIQNMDELLASGIKLAFSPSYSFLLENYDKITVSKIKKLLVNLPLDNVSFNWITYHKNLSILLPDNFVELSDAFGKFIGENSKPLFCSLDDGVVFSYGHSFLMFNGDPLLRRVSEIVDRVVESGLYNYRKSLLMNLLKLYSRNIAIVHPLDGYYSFNLYHMQPAFYLVLMGWCLSAICFIVEVMYNRVLCKRLKFLKDGQIRTN